MEQGLESKVDMVKHPSLRSLRSWIVIVEDNAPPICRFRTLFLNCLPQFV